MSDVKNTLWVHSYTNNANQAIKRGTYVTDSRTIGAGDWGVILVLCSGGTSFNGTN